MTYSTGNHDNTSEKSINDCFDLKQKLELLHNNYFLQLTNDQFTVSLYTMQECQTAAGWIKPRSLRPTFQCLTPRLILLM